MPRIRGRALRPEEVSQALERLGRSPRHNLFLMELVDQVGAAPAEGESPVRVLGAWQRSLSGAADLRGLLSLRPSICLEHGLSEACLEALLPSVDALDVGLVKSGAAQVDRLWRRLASRGRRLCMDRRETCFVAETGRLRPAPPPPGAILRPAAAGDWDPLVEAARASLREEQRPDPFEGDPVGFRRWVRGRIHRARVVEMEGRIVFVAYADVRRPQGWLVQGVYTWPAFRRRGIAAAGMSALAEEAFAAGSDHVQLAVIAGNTSAESLYRRLGFEPFEELRTLLFR